MKNIINISNYTVVDIETTGFNKNSDEIIEIAALKVRNNVITEQFQQLINPQVLIKKNITDLTGINNEMVKDMPDKYVTVMKLKDFIEDDIILGHNISFDLGFICTTLKELDLSLNNDSVDTLNISRKIISNIENYKLTTLRSYFKIENEAHRALEDCIATKKIYDELIKLSY
ncbi:PolC-type DNA polymerase III [Mycoplasma sp. P36-A1]|uniref:3'-5' exonuclease n=1 Tax=Mycoplasma sp. P36-A1 TaxID=3252900 RepID=UPI003C2F9BB9